MKQRSASLLFSIIIAMLLLMPLDKRVTGWIVDVHVHRWPFTRYHVVVMDNKEDLYTCSVTYGVYTYLRTYGTSHITCNGVPGSK